MPKGEWYLDHLKAWMEQAKIDENILPVEYESLQKVIIIVKYCIEIKSYIGLRMPKDEHNNEYSLPAIPTLEFPVRSKKNRKVSGRRVDCRRC